MADARKGAGAADVRASPVAQPRSDGSATEHLPDRPAKEVPLSIRRKLASRKLWPLLLAELAVVFLGVFGAVVAEGYRQDREDAAQRHHLLVSLNQALDDLERHNRDVGGEIDTSLALFDAARSEGKRVVPVFHRARRTDRPPTIIWDALIASEGARLLPPDVLFNLARFFNSFNAYADRYRRYNEFTETRLLPDQYRGPQAFYGANGDLLPEYRAHVDRLRELRDAEIALVSRARKVREALARLEES